MAIELPFGTKREMARWYKLIDHPVQDALVSDPHRFRVIPAGRRSGKTERFKRYVVREAFRNADARYFAAAPTRDQAKKIFWEDLKLLSFSSTHLKSPSETELKIFFPNGTTIEIIGLDKPERIEGPPWTGGGIDEFANVKEHAWGDHISPALDTFNPLTPELMAWCWLFGVPEGRNHYYDLYNYALSSGDPDWKAYTWFSSDILPAKTIEAAKRRMSKAQYQQEYEAEFSKPSGTIYPDYGPLNYTTEQIRPYERILWCHDQNYTPLSSAIGVERDGKVYLLDEIVLESAVSKQSALEFVERYRDHQNKSVWIYGDPSGRDGEKHGHDSDYTDIESVLRANGWRYKRKVANSHPAVKNRQNNVRAMICNAKDERRLFVNPFKAVHCDKGLAGTKLLKGSSFQEDQSDKYQHITTAIGYMISYQWPIKAGAGKAVPFTFIT